ncbi:hypothetical protein H4219_001343 [Mycoemilia scoparia]|uniref:Uncharacterized protein n=1 Tax=Mycoemilia scoparia TaxID=417184 RepID=A0A9W8A9Q0_9FUNG|nr:hypothetical protein H4219_001343 [Mycoemilia scoparia]
MMLAQRGCFFWASWVVISWFLFMNVVGNPHSFEIKDLVKLAPVVVSSLNLWSALQLHRPRESYLDPKAGGSDNNIADCQICRSHSHEKVSGIPNPPSPFMPGWLNLRAFLAKDHQKDHHRLCQLCKIQPYAPPLPSSPDNSCIGDKDSQDTTTTRSTSGGLNDHASVQDGGHPHNIHKATSASYSLLSSFLAFVQNSYNRYIYKNIVGLSQNFVGLNGEAAENSESSEEAAAAAAATTTLASPGMQETGYGISAGHNTFTLMSGFISTVFSPQTNSRAQREAATDNNINTPPTESKTSTELHANSKGVSKIETPAALEDKEPSAASRTPVAEQKIVPPASLERPKFASSDSFYKINQLCSPRSSPHPEKTLILLGMAADTCPNPHHLKQTKMSSKTLNVTSYHQSSTTSMLALIPAMLFVTMVAF